jgi:hypothetical protein
MFHDKMTALISLKKFCSIIPPQYNTRACQPKEVIPPMAEPVVDGFKTQHLTCMKEFYHSRTHAGEDIYNPDFFYKAFDTCEPRVPPQEAEIFGGWAMTSYSERVSIAHKEMLHELSPMPAVEPGKFSREMSHIVLKLCMLGISIILLAGVIFLVTGCFFHLMRKREMARDRLVENEDQRSDRRAASEKREFRHIRWADEE